MALIDITVDQPALINAGEGRKRPTSEDTEAEDESAAEANGSTAETDDTVKTVSELLTAATTVADVLKELRSEDGQTEAAEPFEDTEGATPTEEEAETFVESVGEETADEEAVDEDIEESEAEDAEEAEDSAGIGLLAAFILVVILVAVALWTRDDEEATDDDWD